MKLFPVLTSILFVLFCFACATKNDAINATVHQEISKKTSPFKVDLMISEKDTTILLLTIKNHSIHNMYISDRVDSGNNHLDIYSLATGKGINIDDPGIGDRFILKPGHSYTFEWDYLDMISVNLEVDGKRDRSGWYKLNWNIEEHGINESIRVYYDYQLFKKRYGIK